MDDILEHRVQDPVRLQNFKKFSQHVSEWGRPDLAAVMGQVLFGADQSEEDGEYSHLLPSPHVASIPVGSSEGFRTVRDPGRPRAETEWDQQGIHSRSGSSPARSPASGLINVVQPAPPEPKYTRPLPANGSQMFSSSSFVRGALQLAFASAAC
eukprot:7453335-Pyramimonas_sp.AAC.1